MLRLDSEALSPAWSEFLISLILDLKPLGYFARVEEHGAAFALGTTIPFDRGDIRYEECWHNAHALRHQTLLEQHRAEILAFEDEFAQLFVDMPAFQPSAVRPVLQTVDFNRLEHIRIVEYLKLYQSVTAGKAVGRRMGLLIWDIGQADFPRLFGAAVLASTRFSQPARDRRLGWLPDYPKTSVYHDPDARDIRVAGLARMMQLSLACALPPYSALSGAWLAAMAPFTELGLKAFRKSLKTPDPGADLAAVVTTTGMAISGAPFRGHRVVQLAPKGVAAASGASGNLYSRAEGPVGALPLRASFEDLISPSVWEKARRLFEEERPDRYTRFKSPDRSAMGYALRRLALNWSLFDGNEMGVHIGALGADTLEYLRTGQPRPKHARALLDWDQVVDVWARRFLPAPATVGESAQGATRAKHREARQRRLDAARHYPADRIKLSSRLDGQDPTVRVRIADLAR
jgi:hypothetical protein